jgi:hypothetical protein
MDREMKSPKFQLTPEKPVEKYSGLRLQHRETTFLARLPDAYAADLTATGARLRNSDQLAARLLLTPRRKAYQLPRL